MADSGDQEQSKTELYQMLLQTCNMLQKEAQSVSETHKKLLDQNEQIVKFINESQKIQEQLLPSLKPSSPS